MEAITLSANPRKVTGKKVKALRREGLVPGVIYGSGTDPVHVQFDTRTLERTVQAAGSSTLISIDVLGIKEPYTVIVRDIQLEPIKRNILHVDFQALNLKETVRVPVSLVLVGESPAVVDQAGVLLQHLNEIEIECLPTALIPSIEIDISVITEIGQSISVEDLDIPDDIEVLTSMQEVVVQVTAMAEEEEEEEEEFELEPAAGDVEVIGRGKTEEEEGEEEA